MKKMFSLALALIMALALCVPAFAVPADAPSANENDNPAVTGSITVSNPVEGETYSAYRIFDLVSYNNDAGAFSYKINAKWGDWVKTNATAYVTVDDLGYVTWVEKASAAEFAKLALAAGIAKDGESITAVKDQPVVFDNLPLGYYLIDSSLGTLCTLDTTNNNVSVIEKNSVPSVEKFVEEDSKEGDAAWGETNNADIGQIVNFKSVVSVPAAEDTDATSGKSGIQNLVLHDKMDAVLMFQDDIVVYVDPENADDLQADEILAATNYEVKKNIAHPAKGEAAAYTCTFEVKFNQTYLDSLDATEHTFVVTYSAKVSADATADTAYENATGITYGDNSESVWDTTETKTYDFNLLKYTMKGENEEELAGAEFKLSKKSDGSDPIAFVELKTDDVITGYRVATNADTTTTTTLKAGSINILGLDADVYYLTETKAPDGYNKLAAPVYVQITDASATMVANPDYQKEGATTADQAYVAVADDLVKVLNQTGTELPSTGGIGTTIFYTVGGVMMAAAVVLFVTKKKLAVQE